MAKLLSPLGLSPSQNQRIRGLLEKCTLDHEARMENLKNELRERALSDARWRQIQEELSESVCANHSLLLCCYLAKLRKWC